MSGTQRETLEEYDVLVIGGGPAGSTVAALLARRGRKVALVEKTRHPRFHIGESLLPMNLPIFERLGVLDRVHAMGIRKLGADFPAANDQGYHVFRFDRALQPDMPFAYQVRRDQLDAMLYEHAGRCGATSFDESKVTTVEFRADHVLATVARESGTQVIRARYLVDATGRDAFLGGVLKLRRRHSKHQTAALFAHFDGVELRPGEDAGNISIYRFAHGWVWMIPLPDKRMSIGAVCTPDYLKQREGSTADFLVATLRGIPEAWKRMTHASVADNAHATGNYSYTCKRMTGPGWMMAGDAGAFVDPMFSSGVFLAMNSAELAAAAVDDILQDRGREHQVQQRYERRVRDALRMYSWFIYRFTTPAMKSLFSDPRNPLQVEQAMISMLSGDLFRRNGVRWRLVVFRGIYWLSVLGHFRESFADFRVRRRQVKARFTGGTTSQDYG